MGGAEAALARAHREGWQSRGAASLPLLMLAIVRDSIVEYGTHMHPRSAKMNHAEVVSGANSLSRPTSTALILSSRILIASGTSSSGWYWPVDSTLTECQRETIAG